MAEPNQKKKAKNIDETTANTYSITRVDRAGPYASVRRPPSKKVSRQLLG